MRKCVKEADPNDKNSQKKKTTTEETSKKNCNILFVMLNLCKRKTFK